MEGLIAFYGSMYAGKSESLTRYFERKTRIGIKADEIQAFNHCWDTRYGNNMISSHSGMKIESVPVQRSLEIEQRVKPGTKVVIVDEAQFFDCSISDVLLRLAYCRNSDFTVTPVRDVVFGFLETDFTGEPFVHSNYGSVNELIGSSNIVNRLYADCQYVSPDGEVCGKEAKFSQRIVNGIPANYWDPVVVPGAKESYSAVCGRHHIVPGKREHYAVLNLLRVLNDYNRLAHAKSGVSEDNIKRFLESDEVIESYARLLKSSLSSMLYEIQSIEKDFPNGDPNSSDEHQGLKKRLIDYQNAEALLINYKKNDAQSIGSLEDIIEKVKVLTGRRKIVEVNGVIIPL